MAIVNMSKFELLAFKSDKEAIVSEIQKLEYAHYADLNKKTDEGISKRVRNRFMRGFSDYVYDTASPCWSPMGVMYKPIPVPLGRECGSTPQASKIP